MNDTESMEFIEAFAYSFQEGLPLVLFEFALKFEDVVELSSFAVFQKKIKVLAVLEEGVELNNIGVIEEGLYLYLANKLLCEIFLFDGLFLYGFDG